MQVQAMGVGVHQGIVFRGSLSEFKEFARKHLLAKNASLAEKLSKQNEERAREVIEERE